MYTTHLVLNSALLCYNEAKKGRCGIAIRNDSERDGCECDSHWGESIIFIFSIW